MNPSQVSSLITWYQYGGRVRQKTLSHILISNYGYLHIQGCLYFLRTTYTDMNLFMITSSNSDWLILWSAANFFVILASSAARTWNGTFAWECMRIESAKTVLNKHNHILGRELLCPNLGESLEMESAYGGIITHSLLPRRGSPKLRDTEMYFVSHICRNARGVRIICD